MGYSPKEAAEFVRFSPGRKTTVGEIHETLAAIGEICRKRF
jgi:cysteine sulfinate desulfinase/cysteine desulfurase-like protein